MQATCTVQSACLKRTNQRIVLVLRKACFTADNADLLAFMKEHAECMDYDYGDIVMHEDDPVDGVHIVVYGLIKVGKSGDEKALERSN